MSAPRFSAFLSREELVNKKEKKEDVDRQNSNSRWIGRHTLHA
jgi:hypothetical protein